MRHKGKLMVLLGKIFLLEWEWSTQRENLIVSTPPCFLLGMPSATWHAQPVTLWETFWHTEGGRAERWKVLRSSMALLCHKTHPETTYFRLLDKSFVITLVTFILLLAAKYILINIPSFHSIWYYRQTTFLLKTLLSMIVSWVSTI